MNRIRLFHGLLGTCALALALSPEAMAGQRTRPQRLPTPPRAAVPAEPPAPPCDDDDCCEEPERPGVRVVKRVVVRTGSVSPKDLSHLRIVVGKPGGNEANALKYLEEGLRGEVGEWLSQDGVPLAWSPPKSILNNMFLREAPRIESRKLSSIDAVFYTASRPANFSPEVKRRLLTAYHKQIAFERGGVLAGVLGFLVVGLAMVAGYIRADEATKGYFTWPLRVAATGGLAVAGFVLYRFLIS